MTSFNFAETAKSRNFNSSNDTTTFEKHSQEVLYKDETQTDIQEPLEFLKTGGREVIIKVDDLFRPKTM